MATNLPTGIKQRRRFYPSIFRASHQASMSRPMVALTSEPVSSFESASNWIRSYRYVVETLVNLLKQYPELTRDCSLTPLLELSPTLSKPRAQQPLKNTGREGYFAAPSRSRTFTNSPSPQERIKNVMEGVNPSTPKIHLISHLPNDQCVQNRYKQLVQTLHEFFFVRTRPQTCQGSTTTNGQNEKLPEFVNINFIAESDLCVYIFDDETLNDQRCFNDLCIAMMLKVPILYIRVYKYELPKDFCDTVHKSSKGCMTLKEYVDKCICKTGSDKNKRRRSGPRKVPRSNSQSNMYKTLDHQRMAPAMKKISQQAPELPSPDQTDLLFSLVNNFKTAFVYDDTDRDGGHLVKLVDKIRRKINKATTLTSFDGRESSESLLPKIENRPLLPRRHWSSKDASDHESLTVPLNPSDSSNHLRVPDPADVLSTREWANSGAVSAPPRSTRRDRTRHRVPTGSMDSETSADDSQSCADNDNPDNGPIVQDRTSYLVFSTPHRQKGPHRVVFQSNQDADSVVFPPGAEGLAVGGVDSRSSMESPISFWELDLCREINTVRLTPESDTFSVEWP